MLALYFRQNYDYSTFKIVKAYQYIICINVRPVLKKEETKIMYQLQVSS
jgi:hypothetical protein